MGEYSWHPGHVIKVAPDLKAVVTVHAIVVDEIRYAHKRHEGGGLSGCLQQRWVYEESLADGTRRRREEWRDIPQVTINDKGEIVG